MMLLEDEDLTMEMLTMEENQQILIEGRVYVVNEN